MRSMGIWEVGQDGQAMLSRAVEAEIALERHLEDWIEFDPTLLREGLVIVGRQVYVQSGPLDLLALDQQGRWVVIELKRGDLSEQVVTQVIDYAACLRELSAGEFRSRLEPHLAKRGLDLDALLEQRGAPDALEPEHRELLLFVVGTGKAGSLERMVSFLSEPYGLPISAVLLQVFKLDDGRMVLSREVTEQETSPDRRRAGESLTREAVLQLADRFGTRRQFDDAIELAATKGLPIHPWKTSLMFTPPTNASRCLFTMWAEPDKAGLLKVYVAIEPFVEFFDLDREDVEARLGSDGWHYLDKTGFEALMEGIEGLDLSAG
jgi:hypothetical protein